MSPRLRRIRPEEIVFDRRQVLDTETINTSATILEEVRKGGEAAVRRYAEKFGDVAAGGPLIYGREELARALSKISQEKRALLSRTAQRIGRFAKAQLGSISEMEISVDAGSAGQSISPMQRAGCYAPGGRFPLPSSVLMTAVTARVAGVPEVWTASPKPSIETLAAASVAGADGLLAVGGAQAVAALAFGMGPLPPCDIIVGPGNRFVTAAKKLVSGEVAIDMLAGPSELVVLADATADPATVAADLLAQAEHDTDALPVLVSLSAELIDSVIDEVDRQLATLPTAATASPAIEHGFAVRVDSIEEGAALCDKLAPEHLEVMTANPDSVALMLSNYGAIFIGPDSAEVMGDYGAGPNHVLPTGYTARFTGGLSVFNFLRIRTWMNLSPGAELSALAKDARDLARIEGLEGHARAAEKRIKE